MPPETFNLSVTLQNSGYLVYLDANIGTPAQNIKLGIDLFITEAYVVDKDAKINCNNDGPTLYDYSKSSSYSLIKNYTEKYGSDFLVQDKIQVIISFIYSSLQEYVVWPQQQLGTT